MIVVVLSGLQVFGLVQYALLISNQEHNCLGIYAMVTFSIHYFLFILIILRSVVVLCSYCSERRARPRNVHVPSGLSGQIGIINDPLHITSEAGKFEFDRVLAQIEDPASNFDLAAYLKRNEAPVRLLKASKNEIQAYKYMFVRKLDFSSGNSDQFREQECPICVEKYEDGQEVMVLSECSHHFHWLCIEAWLKKSTECPMCRHSMREDLLGSLVKMKEMF